MTGTFWPGPHRLAWDDGSGDTGRGDIRFIRIGVGTEGWVMTHPTPSQTIDAPTTLSPPRPRARALLAATLMGGALLLAACSSSGSSTPTTAASATPTTAASATPTTASGSSAGTTGAHTIAIKNFAFAPSTITVAPGAAVTVTNNDQVAHTVTSSKGGFDTGDIQPGQSKTITAPNTPGTYPYICSIHQYMTGTLVVSG